jgi:hypothetical protein
VRRGAFRLRELRYTGGAGAAQHRLRCSAAAGGKAWAPENSVERVLVAGLKGRRPARVSVAAGNATEAVDWAYAQQADVLTIRKPMVKVAYDWEIVLDF